MRAADKKMCPFYRAICKGKVCVAYSRGGTNRAQEWTEFCNMLPRGNPIGSYKYSDDDKPEGQ